MVQTTACPPGWRVSTNAELDAEGNNWDSNDAAGAFDSELKWPVARYHTYTMVRSTVWAPTAAIGQVPLMVSTRGAWTSTAVVPTCLKLCSQ